MMHNEDTKSAAVEEKGARRLAGGGTEVSPVPRSTCACDTTEVEMLGVGAIAKKIKFGEIRELTQGDLKVLREPRKQSTVARFRDSHRRLAWYFAIGMNVRDASIASGYSYNRVSTLHSDPAFQQLIAEIRDDVDNRRAEAVDEFEEIVRKNMIAAERMISDKLEDADENDEALPTRELIAISRDAADRLGYGKKSTQVNVNVDFAAKLDRAMQRSAKVIDVSPTQVVAQLVRASSAAAPRAPARLPPPVARRDEPGQPLRRRRVA